MCNRTGAAVSRSARVRTPAECVATATRSARLNIEMTLSARARTSTRDPIYFTAVKPSDSRLDSAVIAENDVHHLAKLQFLHAHRKRNVQARPGLPTAGVNL
jgi:hypothetical protein